MYGSILGTPGHWGLLSTRTPKGNDNFEDRLDRIESIGLRL